MSMRSKYKRECPICYGVGCQYCSGTGYLYDRKQYKRDKAEYDADMYSDEPRRKRWQKLEQ
jgi:hypothetical protein